jgi:hypothetical protein
MTALQALRPRNRDPLPAGARGLPSAEPNCQTGSETQQASYPMNKGGYFPGGKGNWERVDTFLYITPRLDVRGAITFLRDSAVGIATGYGLDD